MRLRPNQRELLFRFRDLMKEAGISIEAKDVVLHCDTGAVRMDWLMTFSDDSPMELAFGIQEARPVAEFHTTARNHIKEE